MGEERDRTSRGSQSYLEEALCVVLHAWTTAIVTQHYHPASEVHGAKRTRVEAVRRVCAGLLWKTERWDGLRVVEVIVDEICSIRNINVFQSSKIYQNVS